MPDNEDSHILLIRQVFGVLEVEAHRDEMPPVDKSMRKAVDTAMRLLLWKEEVALRYRYGFVDGKVHTYEEVGILFNVSGTRARQIAAKALRKLRHPSRNQYIKPFRGHIPSERA